MKNFICALMIVFLAAFPAMAVGPPGSGGGDFDPASPGEIGATTPAAGTFTSVTIAKQSGVAGDMGLYEANSTDTHSAGFRGPDSITGDGAYRIKFPDARAAGAGRVLAVTNAGESGTGTAADPYVQTGSWITPATLTGSETLTNKTLTAPVVNGATGTGGKFTGDLTGLAPSVVIPVSSGTSADVASETVLTHADDGSAENAYVGMTLYNITDSVSGVVTASTSTTITVAAGSMSWANTNAYQLGPGPSQSGSVFYVAGAGTIRHPATAGYAACYVADGTNKLTIDMASDSMIFTGTLDAAVVTLDAGDCLDSSDTTTDDFICLHNKSATSVKGLGKRGTWVDGGAS